MADTKLRDIFKFKHSNLSLVREFLFSRENGQHVHKTKRSHRRRYGIWHWKLDTQLQAEPRHAMFSIVACDYFYNTFYRP